jgi:hypothetical protein
VNHPQENRGSATNKPGSDEEPEMEVREAWSSGKPRPSCVLKPSQTQSQELQTLKDRGNESLKAGDPATAVQLYSEAIAKGKQDSTAPEQMAICYSNRSAAHFKMGDFVKVLCRFSVSQQFRVGLCPA